MPGPAEQAEQVLQAVRAHGHAERQPQDQQAEPEPALTRVVVGAVVLDVRQEAGGLLRRNRPPLLTREG